jgi:hypothetical protein
MKQAIETPEQIWDDDFERTDQRRPILDNECAPICSRDVALDAAID